MSMHLMGPLLLLDLLVVNSLSSEAVHIKVPGGQEVEESGLVQGKARKG